MQKGCTCTALPSHTPFYQTSIFYTITGHGSKVQRQYSQLGVGSAILGTLLYLVFFPISLFLYFC